MAVFDAVIWKHFSVHVKKHCFLILQGMMLTHALWNETFLYSEVSSSFLVNTLQTLSKSVYNCQSYWLKKAQLSLTNPRDVKVCPKLLQFDVLTTLSLTILAYLHAFSCCCDRNLRNPAKFTENSNHRVQGHPRSSILSLIHIWRCRRSYACRSRWSPYH